MTVPHGTIHKSQKARTIQMAIKCCTDVQWASQHMEELNA